jgi:hypothetical protein
VTERAPAEPDHDHDGDEERRQEPAHDPPQLAQQGHAPGIPRIALISSRVGARVGH